MEVFLSYCSLDRDKVCVLADALRDHGLTVWWDTELVGGGLWKPEIAKRLGEADAVVVLWTENSVDRPFVRAEAAMGLGYDCLLSVRYARDVEPPEAFQKIHAEFLGDWNGKEKRAPEIGKLVKQIRDKKAARDRQKRVEALPEFEKIRKKAGPVAALFGSALPGGLAISSFLLGVILPSLGIWILLALVSDNQGLNQQTVFLAAAGLAGARALDQFLIASRKEISIRFFDRSFSRIFAACLLMSIIFFAALYLLDHVRNLDVPGLGTTIAYATELTFILLVGACLVRLGIFLTRSLASRL